MLFFRSDPLWILDRVSLRDLWHTDLARLHGQAALGSPCLHLYKPEITDVYHYSWLFTWALEISLGS